MRRTRQNDTRTSRPCTGWVFVAVLLVGGVVLLWGAMRGSVGVGGAFSPARWQGVWQCGQFRLFVGVGAISTVLLATTAALAWRIGRRRGRRLGAQAGTVIIEFVLILPILLMLSLMLVQSSMLMGGFLSCNYAAYCGARSAVVHVPLNTEDEPANQVASRDGPGTSDKMTKIWRAAVWPLMPLGQGSYDAEAANSNWLEDGLDDLFTARGRTPPDWIGTVLARRLAYVEDHTNVSLVEEAGENDDGEAVYTDRQDLTVWVTHDLYMPVPYADRMFALLDSGNAVELDDSHYAIQVRTRCTMLNQGRQDWIDVETFD